MKKLFAFADNHLLKYLVAFTFLFVAWYPKLPSIHIVRTWVYIRLEDFLIALVVALFLTQLARKKAKIAWPIGLPIGIYWISGFLSLLFSLIFIGPHLAGFFPHLAILEYGRRIEYMILFFVAFATIQNADDLKHYVIAVCITLFGIVIYGFGQEYYLQLWAVFPKFFEKYPFCFPSFQTGNEEFAKGLPLCLPAGARITSTFGGHYDLAGFLVVILPIVAGIFLAVKKAKAKIVLALLFISSLTLLIFTSSRVSFFAYLIGVVASLIFLQKKKWLIPLLGISLFILLLFSGSTAKRIFETFRIVNVITNSQGKVVGVAATNLPQSLQNKIAKNDSVVVEAPPPTENLPTGSSFINLPQAPVATSVAVVKNQIPSNESIKLRLANGGLQLSTVSGSFLIQKSLAYDISFTTRFQSEWPTAWNAFLLDPPLGKGYSTITLATDNDYLRLLGESGFLGFTSFFLIFIFFGILAHEKLKYTDSHFIKGFVLGLAGGVIGLFINAALIDVFEASKIAETLWILLGIGVGVLCLLPGKVNFFKNIWKVLTAKTFLILYLLIIIAVTWIGILPNFFVGDDFTWLHWSAASLPKDLLKNFFDAKGFFYRPLDKLVVYFLYTFFSLEPQGYHLFTIFLHYLMTIGVFFVALKVLGKKQWAFLAAVLFSMLPILSENLNWFSTLSIELSSVFLIFASLSYMRSREKNSLVFYFSTLVLFVLGLFSYEMSVIFPLLALSVEAFVVRKLSKKSFFTIGIFVLIDFLYLVVRSLVHVAPVSGDYSYSLIHLLPNIFGNLFGYAGLSVLGGQWYQPYEFLRTVLKGNAVLIGLLLGGLIVVAGVLWGKKLLVAVAREKAGQLIFAFSWIVIGLLPFLGLGNISERYGYFASVGFALVAVYLLRCMWTYLSQRMPRKQAIGVFALILCVIVVWSQYQIRNEEGQWQKAGNIAQEALAVFTFNYNYGVIPSRSHLYIANVPIRYGNAWVFPVGLFDGIWFVYKDATIQVVQTATVVSGKAAIVTNPAQKPGKDFLFSFDKSYTLSEVK